MNNAFYFILRALKIFKTLFWPFLSYGKRLDKKAKVYLKIYDVTNWITNTYYKSIVRYLSKYNMLTKFNQLEEYNGTNIFLKKSCR